MFDVAGWLILAGVVVGGLVLVLGVGSATEPETHSPDRDRPRR